MDKADSFKFKTLDDNASSIRYVLMEFDDFGETAATDGDGWYDTYAPADPGAVPRACRRR